MTTKSKVDPAVTAFLALLAQANSVVAECRILSHWKVSEPNGSADNEIVYFSWRECDGIYRLKLTEGGIIDGKWKGDSFFCCDHEGDDVQISLYKHVAIRPPECKQCGGDMAGGYCSDETCVFSDWPQNVERDDLSVFTTEEVEEKYGIKKRDAGSANGDEDKRAVLADAEFERYDFGGGVTVVAHDNWDKADVDDFTKIVYIAADDDPPDADSERVSFHVRFNADGTVSDAYGLLMHNGSDIGFRPANQSVMDAVTETTMTTH